MSSYYLEWLNLLGRWAHMITGIAWVGASFYFVWLDNHLLDPAHEQDREKGVAGEVWSVHGGGFYHSQKYQLAPQTLPSTLHWFKWEAYTTLISGVFLLALMYWYGAEIYLIDPAVMALPKSLAILIGMLVLPLGWIVYDQLCKSALRKNDLHLGIVMFLVLVVVAFALCQVFSGRGAFMHFGAMLGTIMVANVFFVIIPGQKDLVAAKVAGRSPDPQHGINGKQRSVHNTYFTLPVLLVMISNHYAMTYSHEWNWLILIGLSLFGALIRVYFVQRHKGKGSPLLLIAAALILAAIIAALAPSQTDSQSAATHSHDGSATAGGAVGIAAGAGAGAGIGAKGVTTATDNSSVGAVPVTFASVSGIVMERCAGCHALKPTYPGFYAPPQGLLLDNDENIRAQMLKIYQQSVATKAMPIGNVTGMLDQERELIGRWYRDNP